MNATFKCAGQCNGLKFKTEKSANTSFVSTDSMSRDKRTYTVRLNPFSLQLSLASSRRIIHMLVSAKSCSTWAASRSRKLFAVKTAARVKQKYVKRKCEKRGKCHNKTAHRHTHKRALTQDKSQQKLSVGGSGEEAEEEEAEEEVEDAGDEEERLLDARCRGVQAVAHYLTNREPACIRWMNGGLCRV